MSAGRKRSRLHGHWPLAARVRSSVSAFVPNVACRARVLRKLGRKVAMSSRVRPFLLSLFCRLSDTLCLGRRAERRARSPETPARLKDHT
eukprot:2628813-Pyramimonas_sp.AAC.1